MSYELIETVEVGAGGAASIEFTSIPQDGTDLVLKVSARSNDSAGYEVTSITFNSSSTNFDVIRLEGSNGNVSSNSTTNNWLVFSVPGDSVTANTFGSMGIYISSYAGSSYKSASIESVIENNSTSTYRLGLHALFWNDTSAISSIGLEPVNGTNWLEHSTFSLYKITAA